MRRVLKSVLVLALLGSASAFADNSGQAEERFREGKMLMAAGAISKACEAFTESEKLESSIGALLNLGDCNEKLGRMALAVANFEKAAQQAEAEGDARASYAQERGKTLEPKIARLRVSLGMAPGGFVLTSNGKEVSDLLNVATPLTLGSFEFRGSAPRHEDSVARVSVTELGKSFELVLPKLKPSLVVAPLTPEEVRTATSESLAGQDALPRTEAKDSQVDMGQKSRASHSRWHRNIAIVTGSFGLAAASSGLVFGGLAQAKQSDAREHCNGTLCDQRGVDLRNQARTRADLATAFVVVGAAGLVAGGVLWITSNKPGEAQRLRVGAALLPGETRFTLSGGF